MMLSAACEYRTMHPALYRSEQSERETALLNANTTRGKLHGSSLVMGNKACLLYTSLFSAVRIGADFLNAEDQFIDDVMIIALMLLHTFSWISVDIAPCFIINAVTAEKLNSAGIHILMCSINHSKVFKIIKPSVLGRKYQTGNACVSIHLNLHIPIQLMTQFLIILHVHKDTLLLLAPSSLHFF